jgi:hypothetical protein
MRCNARFEAYDRPLSQHVPQSERTVDTLFINQEGLRSLANGVVLESAVPEDRGGGGKRGLADGRAKRY